MIERERTAERVREKKMQREGGKEKQERVTERQRQ